MRCFYCGRDAKIEYNEDKTLMMARCTYPRCKLKPITDWETSMLLVEKDWDMIKQSLRG